MATVIDRLVVELGLDPKRFTQGQKEALSAFKQTQEELARRGKDVEQGTKSVGQAFTNLKYQALGLLGVFLGGKGLASFTTSVGQADATVGRLSRNIGVSTGTISAWQGALRLSGGEAGDAAGSFKSISDVFAGWKIGIVSPVVADLRAISAAGGHIIDINEGVETSFIKLADNLRAIHLRDPATAGVLGGRIPGMTPAFFDLLIKGGDEVRKILAEVKTLGGTTNESAAAAAELNAEFQKTVLIIEDISRKLLIGLVKPVREFATSLKNAREFWDKGEYKKAAEQFVKVDIRPGSFADEAQKYFWSKERQEADVKRFSGAEPSGVWGSPAKPISVVSVKPGAGTASNSVQKLAEDIQSSVPGIKQFTSFNDLYHMLLGGGSAHSKGRALDFTINDPTKSGEIAEGIRNKLKSAGVDATVIDEYKNPSRGSTAPHIHVQFNTAEAAARYAKSVSGGAAASIDGRSNTSTSNSTKTEISIGQVVVNTPATDGEGVAKDFKAALERSTTAANANAGQQ